jgi:hypothetical protein
MSLNQLMLNVRKTYLNARVESLTSDTKVDSPEVHCLTETVGNLTVNTDLYLNGTFHNVVQTNIANLEYVSAQDPTATATGSVIQSVITLNGYKYIDLYFNKVSFAVGAVTTNEILIKNNAALQLPNERLGSVGVVILNEPVNPDPQNTTVKGYNMVVLSNTDDLSNYAMWIDIPNLAASENCDFYEHHISYVVPVN